MLKTKPCFITLLLAVTSLLAASATADEEKWDISEAHAPTSRLEFVAREGTWMAVDVAPDGKTIAFDLLGHLYEMPIKGGKATPLTSGRSWNMHPRYSPDGTQIAFTSDRGGSDDLWVLDRASGSFTQISEEPMPVYRPTWSRDGRALFGTQLDMGAKSSIHSFDFFGGSQALVEGPVFNTMGQVQEDPERGRIYYEQNDEKLYASGPRIKFMDTSSGEMEVLIERPGGAFNPAISPDGSRLAYLNRADLKTALVVEDLNTRKSRTLSRSIDRDRLEYGAYFYAIYPGMSWHPNGRDIYIGYGGTIHAIDADSGQARALSLEAPVVRDLNDTIRFRIPIPDDRASTRVHRWGGRTGQGIVFEVLGDLWLQQGETARRITDTAAHETTPVFDPVSERIYFARWSDDGLGSLWSIRTDGRAERKLTDIPSQYGALAVSPDGSEIAYVRGQGSLLNGALIENQKKFDLILRDRDGAESVVTQVDWTDAFPAKHPPTVMFHPEGDSILFTEYEAKEEGDDANEVLTLKSIRRDGLDERPLYAFPHAVRVVPSPDLKWIAFREYHRSFIAPFHFLGKPQDVSAMDKLGKTMRVDANDGMFLAWDAEGKTLRWTRGTGFYEKSVEAIVADQELEEDQDPTPAQRTELAISFDVAAPKGMLAMTGARVVPMDRSQSVIENATILIDGARISDVGQGLDIPDDATVLDVSGHTVLPGLIDSHAHPATDMSSLHLIEQRPAGLRSILAHGVTTVYELYGSPGHKDVWLSDMIRSGRIVGPRVFTVGPPIYGLREFRPKLYRGIENYEQAVEHVRYNRDHGATAVKDYVQFTRSSRHQLTTAARELGVNIVAETAGNPAMNLTQVIDGQTGLEHSMGLTPLYDDVVRLLAASDIGITPTLLVVYNGPAGQSYFNMSERVWENDKLLRFARRENLLAGRRPTHYFSDDLYSPVMAGEHKKLMQAGVSIQMGGHGQMLGLDAHWEMQLMVQGGFTPMEALQTATINGARYHGLDEDIGSIEAGKLADLVVMAGDPVNDIRDTRLIRYVVKNGEVFAGADLARVYPEAAPAPKMYFFRD